MFTPGQALTISLLLHAGGVAAAMVWCPRVDRPIGWQGQEASTRCEIRISTRPSILVAASARPPVAQADDAVPAAVAPAPLHEAPPAPAAPREPAPEPAPEPPPLLPDVIAAAGATLPEPAASETPPEPVPPRVATSSPEPAPEASSEPAPAVVEDVPVPPESAAAVASVDRASVLPSPLEGHQPPPFYPVREMHKGHEGTVILSLRIGADGCVLQADVVTSSGWPRLDAAAVAALSQWKFAPARNAAGAHETTIEWPVVFRITGVKASPPAGIG